MAKMEDFQKPKTHGRSKAKAQFKRNGPAHVTLANSTMNIILFIYLLVDRKVDYEG